MRTCGPCTACCTVMAVPELKKPAGKGCDHLCTLGCEKYEGRPQSCRDFACLWLLDPDETIFRNMERPDSVGVMFDCNDKGSAFVEKVGVQALVARAVWPGAFQDANAKALLTRLARRTVIITIDGEKRDILGPEVLLDKVSEYLKSQKEGESK